MEKADDILELFSKLKFVILLFTLKVSSYEQDVESSFKLSMCVQVFFSILETVRVWAHSSSSLHEKQVSSTMLLAKAAVQPGQRKKTGHNHLVGIISI